MMIKSRRLHQVFMKAHKLLYRAAILVLALCLPAAVYLTSASGQNRGGTKEETAILDQLSRLRGLPDDVRARTTRQLALDIRQLGNSPRKLNLASSLANYSTEGDFGRETLQEVATTLAEALREQPPGTTGGQPA